MLIFEEKTDVMTETGQLLKTSHVTEDKSECQTKASIFE
jgi:hypothetical protein